MKELIIFDLDGTLAKSKSIVDEEMASLLSDLLSVVYVAIISGGDWAQFEKQVLSQLSKDAFINKLAILPTCGTKFYQFKNNWQLLYAENFTDKEKAIILNNLNEAVEETGLNIPKTWGNQIEDRGSQITFSALEQKAPLEAKQEWNLDFTKRSKIIEYLKNPLQEFSVNMGGKTSIDITKKGIDKSYGIHKLEEVLGYTIDKMMFVGDALFEGGNDYPAKTTGVDCIQVKDPDETKVIIKTLVICLSAKEYKKH